MSRRKGQDGNFSTVKTKVQNSKRKTIDLDALEKRLLEVKLPQTIKLDNASVITDVVKFFKSHICVLRNPKIDNRIKILHEDRILMAGAVIKKFNAE